MVAGSQARRSFSTALSVHKQEPGREVEQPELRVVLSRVRASQKAAWFTTPWPWAQLLAFQHHVPDTIPNLCSAAICAKHYPRFWTVVVRNRQLRTHRDLVSSVLSQETQTINKHRNQLVSGCDKKSDKKENQTCEK